MADDLLVEPVDGLVEETPGYWSFSDDLELTEDPVGSGFYEDRFWNVLTPPTNPLLEAAYANLGPWSRADESGQLWEYLKVLLDPLLEIDDYVRDTDTHMGFGRLLDIDNAPAWVLPWLAQFVGVTTLKGIGASSQRIRVKEAAGFHRGTPSAIIAAAKQYLTGSRRVELYEREGSAWAFRLRTYAAETPDAQKVYDAVYALKPAGIVFTYELQQGVEIDGLSGTIDGLTGTIASYNSTTPV